ncbi:MAG TPA: head-tail connector protein [Allosphingosinicella sp.]|jgi:uncharacterized phiE125 gp8 family phage protein
MAYWDRLKRSVAPAETIVALAEAKAHLNVSHADDDELIETLIAAATGAIDGPNGIGIALITQEWRMSLDSLPASFTLPLGPVQTLDEITYSDAAGNEHTLAPASYRLDADSSPARVFCETPISPASVQPGTVKVAFTCGYGDLAEDVPIDLRHAVLMLVAHFYENREAATAQGLVAVPFGVSCILDRYRSLAVG